MPYINEEISEQDYEKYNLEDGTSEEWAIDRERGIWFRELHELVDREEDLGAEINTEWQFYWKGALIELTTKFLNKKFTEDIAEYYAYIKILDINIPKELEQYKEEMLKELKEAFEALNADVGIDDEIKACRVDLEYEGKLI